MLENRRYQQVQYVQCLTPAPVIIVFCAITVGGLDVGFYR